MRKSQRLRKATRVIRRVLRNGAGIWSEKLVGDVESMRCDMQVTGSAGAKHMARPIPFGLIEETRSIHRT